MENLTNSAIDKEMINLDNDGLRQLAETRKWSMFLSILGFVFLGLLLVIAIVLISVGTAALVPLLILSIIYFFPIYYLFNFSYYSRQALMNKDNGLLSKALRYLKMHYRFMGILAIVILSLYLLIFLIALFSGNFMNMFHHYREIVNGTQQRI